LRRLAATSLVRRPVGTRAAALVLGVTHLPLEALQPIPNRTRLVELIGQRPGLGSRCLVQPVGHALERAR
jgi:hypothetical protein